MSTSTRVAFLSEHASPVALLGGEDAGGQNVYVDQVARELGALGHAVDIFTRRDDPGQEPVIDWAPGVRVINVTAGPARFLLKDDIWRHMPEFRDGVSQFIRNQQRRYDIIHGNFWMSGWAAAELRRDLEIPAVQIYHAFGTTKRREQGSADTSPAERIAIEREVARRVDRIIAQCPNDRRELVEDYGADPEHIDVIPSAVSAKLFHPVDQAAARREIGLNPDDLIVVYVGRLLPRKDIRNVVRATAKLCQSTDLPIKLLVVGGETRDPDPTSTPELGELQHLASELGMRDRVLFTGKRQQSELSSYYSAGDVAVTTPWYEPFGLTPLEAMACAKPVVGSDVGGISFTVQDGRTGFLVPPRDPDALAERLLTLLADRDLRAKFGTAARQRVEEQFVWPIVARRVSRLYERVLAEQRAMTLKTVNPVGRLAFVSASSSESVDPTSE